MDSHTVTREFDFRPQYEEAVSLLNSCLCILDEVTPSHNITQKQIEEMAQYLSNAIAWFNTFAPSKPTIRKINDMRKKQKAINLYLSTDIEQNERQWLQEKVRTLDMMCQLERAGMAGRHMRPHDYLDPATGKPAIVLFSEAATEYFKPTESSYSRPATVKKIRDTKTKLFKTFFHSSSQILAGHYGAQIFLAIVYSEIYLLMTRGQKHSNKDYRQVFENRVKPLLHLK